MNIKKNKSIGIWGYAVVGKSAVTYFLSQNYIIHLLDKRSFTTEEKDHFSKNNITFYSEKEKNDFFNASDLIISSPGIYIAHDYDIYKHKWMCELDVFFALFKKPIIAITGSVGKTSCMHMLSSFLSACSIKHTVGGNIGTATFDLLSQESNVSYALLEVSSFQLEYCSTFAPKLAIITNIYPNHLDHHKTKKNYFNAKCALVKHQKENTYSLIPLSLKNKVPAAHTQHQRSYFSTIKPDKNILQQLTYTERIYYSDNKKIYCCTSNSLEQIFSYENTNTFFFNENILITIAACDILAIERKKISSLPLSFELPAHRLELVGSYNSCSFYNDSKATTTASTLAAINQLQSQSLHLFIGGLSKGVDRSSFIAELKNKVQFVYCFGTEAQSLYEMCLHNYIPAQAFSTLDMAVTDCMKRIAAGDCVLLSPAGSSYDLYKNYEERGEHFKQLITIYML